MKHILLIIIASIYLLCSCKPDENVTPSASAFDSGKMLVLNEGNFMWGNASMSLYALNNDSVIGGDIYHSLNQEVLGDVLQSACMIKDRIYLVVNNSAKIIVLNKKTLKKEQEKSGLGSPRYIVDGMNNYLYLSDLYANEIKVLNVSDLSVHSSIPCVGWTDKMFFFNSKIYVCNKKSKQLYVISTISNTIVDSVNIGYGANSIAMDNLGRLWVSSEGKSDISILPNISRFTVGSSSLSLDTKWEFTASAPSSVCTNAARDKIYYIVGEQVFQMNSNSTALPSTATVSKSGAIWYGIGVEPISGDLFLSDALDYVQQSTIYRYSCDGSQLKAVKKAGIISNGFLFWE